MMILKGKPEDATDVRVLREAIEGFIDELIADRDLFAERTTDLEDELKQLDARIEELKAELADAKGSDPGEGL